MIGLLSLRLLPFHQYCHEFDWLTLVNSSCFFLSFFFIFNFIYQHWIDCGLNFIIYFNFLSTRLSRSHDSRCEFVMLTRVNSCYLPCLFFLSFNTELLKIKYRNLVLSAFYRVIIVLWLNMQIKKLIWVDLNWFTCFRLNIYKKISY
jgi:hypothetical protein